MTRFEWIACAVAMAALPCQLSAQQPAAAPGERVRVTVSSAAAPNAASGRWEGIFLHSAADSIYVDPKGPEERVAVARHDLVRLERYAGRKGHAGKGALIGGGIGLGLGVLAGVLVATEDCGGNVFCDDMGGYGWWTLLVTVPVGAGIGAGVGAANRSDQWVEAPPAPVSLVPAVGRDRVGLALQVRF